LKLIQGVLAALQWNSLPQSSHAKQCRMLSGGKLFRGMQQDVENLFTKVNSKLVYFKMKKWRNYFLICVLRINKAIQNLTST
jgi:hypothetical protein